MAKEPKLYTRLTRNASGLGSYSSLWLGPDHLLIVRSTGYNENYARIQLRDLQAVFLTESDRRMWWGIVWGVVAAWSGTMVAIALGGGRAPWISGILFAVGAGAFLWNHLLGPGCRAYAVTSVQTADLPPLVRMKKARSVLGRLQPLIAAAQADLVAVPPMPRGESPTTTTIGGEASPPVG